jgi:glycosyltransferase involved in cell wall biosynthesis
MMLGIMFRNFGPYHLGRFDAIRNLCAASALEIAHYDTEYNWESDGKKCRLVHSLADGYPRTRRARYFAINKIKTWLSDIRPDVLAVPGWSEPLALASALEARRKSIPVILMSDSRLLRCISSGLQPRAVFVESFKRRIMGLFNSAFVAGHEHSLYLQSLGMPEQKISLGLDVVDNEHFSSGAAQAREQAAFHRKRLGLPSKYFLLCSRLLPRKNIETAIEAFALFRKHRTADGWQLVIAGDGPRRDILRHIAQEQLVMSDIQFRGAQSYGQLPILYGLSEAFILPSWSETWGLVVNEAMAAGLPVVVSMNAGCVHELVQNGSNGYTFDPRDVGQLARLMSGLAENSQRRKEMGRCSEKIISEWGFSRFAEGMLSAATNAVRDPISQVPTVGLCIAKCLVWQ